MHLFEARVGDGARSLSEFARIVSEYKWRVTVGARRVSRNRACVGDRGGMGDLRTVWGGDQALQKHTCVGAGLLGDRTPIWLCQGPHPWSALILVLTVSCRSWIEHRGCRLLRRIELGPMIITDLINKLSASSKGIAKYAHDPDEDRYSSPCVF